MSIESFRKEFRKFIRPILIIIDKDGVLCPPHSKIEPVKEIEDIAQVADVAIITGAAIDRAQSEVIKPLQGIPKKALQKIHLILNNGARIYSYKDGYECIYKRAIKEEIGDAKMQAATGILQEAIERFPEIRQMKEQHPDIEQICDEETQLTFRILGKMKDDDLRRTFDPHGEKRHVWAQFIRQRFLEEDIRLSVSVDGTSSINILLPGIDKGAGIDVLRKRLGINASSLLYLGDHFGIGRNDRSAVEGRIKLAVNFGPDETIPGTKLINTGVKGPDGVRPYLAVIKEELRGHL